MAVDSNTTFMMLGMALLLCIMGRIRGERFRSKEPSPLTDFGMLIVIVVSILVVSTIYTGGSFVSR